MNIYFLLVLQVVHVNQDEVLPLDPSLQIVFNRPAVESDLETIGLAVQLAIGSAVNSMYM